MKHFLTDPTKLGLWVYLFCLMLFCLITLRTARSDGPAESDMNIRAQLDQAIEYLVGNVRSPVGRATIRREYIESVIAASAKYEIPELLLVTIAYREGSFRNDVEGTIGEHSTYQIHGIAARGCDLRSYAGASLCAARWLRHCHDRCGSWDGAVSLYASGRTCTPDRARLRRVVADRIALWKELEEL